MKTYYITYRHASGNITTQPFCAFTYAEVEEYKEWMLESGEALEIIDG